MAGKSDHFSNGWKIILLQNAIHPLTKQQVKLTADQHRVSSGMDLTFEAYFQLIVYNVAIKYDA
jgi:hypothetical protein